MTFRRPPRRDEETPPPRALAPGVVTRLVAQQKDPLRVSVYLDGAFAFGVHQDVLVAHGLRKGVALDVAQQEKVLADDGRLRARGAALAFLSHRPRTRAEVARKLAENAIPDVVVDEVLAWLEAKALVDDAAYARQYAESRARLSGYGPQRIRQELMRRGVARETIEGALADEVDEDAVRTAAREQALDRWRLLAREPDPRRRRRKLSDYLVRRGFSYDVIAEAMAALPDPDDDDA